MTGGIQATGNYPGKARTAEELRADMEFAMQYIPGVKKVNLHASYLEADTFVDRNEIEPSILKSGRLGCREGDRFGFKSNVFLPS